MSKQYATRRLGSIIQSLKIKAVGQEWKGRKREVNLQKVEKEVELVIFPQFDFQITRQNLLMTGKFELNRTEEKLQFKRAIMTNGEGKQERDLIAQISFPS